MQNVNRGKKSRLLSKLKDVRYVKTVQYAICVMCMISMMTFQLSVLAHASEQKSVRHLIQTTNYQDEYEGLLHLDLLRIHPLEEPDVDKVYDRIAPAIVRITIGDYAGSGIVIALTPEKITILSNKHLLQNGGEGTVTFSQGFAVRGTVSAYSQETDMALMEVEMNTIPYEKLADLRYVTMKNVAYRGTFALEDMEMMAEESTGNLMANDPVILIGSVQEAAGNCEQGSVIEPLVFKLDFYTEMLETDAKAEPGMSGGITCDAYGNMIGMITGDSQIQDRCTYSLPTETIVKQIQLLQSKTAEN